MYTHLTLGTNDVPAAKTFYDALFTAAGGAPGHAAPDGSRVVYNHKGGLLIVTRPVNGEEACHGNGVTIGLHMDSPAQVDAWHAAGLAHGGTAAEDPPGERKMGAVTMYLAYLRDPTGNKLCAVYRAG